MNTLIRVPDGRNKLLQTVLSRVNASEEITTLWDVININAINRLGMSDHGPVHFQIVANIALRFFRILSKKGVEASVVKDFALTNDHAEVIIVLGSILHDLGMSINRDGHEEFSLIIAQSIMRNILDFMPIKERTIVISETLHAIINHRAGGRPMTIEGGIVRVADALDMTSGRSRIPFESGKVDIYSLSAFAIEKIDINEGTDRPIAIEITMNNSAGIFQIDELLKSKLKDSGIAQYIEVKAHIEGEEKQLVKEFAI